MITLYHHAFCPHSRFVRLALGEMGIEPKLVEERSWERRREFLLMAAEGATPVAIDENGPVLPGAEVIAEYLDETRGLASAAGGFCPTIRPGERRRAGWSRGSTSSFSTNRASGSYGRKSTSAS